MSKKEMVAELKANGYKVDGRASEAKVTEMYEDMLASMEASKKEEIVMSGKVRANRVTMVATDAGFTARFFRTHKLLGTIDIPVEADAKGKISHGTDARTKARDIAISRASEIGIDWKPDMQGQAWERKHNIYLTDADVAEDAEILITPALERLVDKCKWDMEIESIDVTGITAKDSSLSYVEDGRYTKSGAWCVADIELEVHTVVNGSKLDVIYTMEMKSGQICKPKTTIAQWEQTVIMEAELQGVVLEVAKEA